MSLAEIKEEVARMTNAELEELAACVRRTRQARDADWLERMERINASMDAGEKYTEADLLSVHEQLEREGR